MPRSSAAAFAAASDTARIAFAPSRDLFAVPSRSIRISSIFTCSVGSMPPIASKISPSTLLIAFCTPLPPNRAGSLSRSSTASCAPVEAPEGTAARPMAPLSSTTSTSTVGLPRLSSISRAIMSAMAAMARSLCFCWRQASTTFGESSLNEFDQRRDALPHANAHRGNRTLAATRFERVQRGQRKACTRHAQWVPERNRPAMRVHVLRIVGEAELARHRQTLSGERLVELDHVDIADLHPQALEQLLRRRRRTD